MVVEAKVTGLPDFREALKGLPLKLRKRALLNALRAAGRVVRDDAKKNAPVLKLATKFRKPGTLKKAISVRTSKLARREGNVGVFINVRPAKKGKRGAKSPDDPFYFRFVNWGTKKMKGAFFLEEAAKKLPDALKVFEKTLGPQIQKLNVRKDAL